LEYGKTTGGDKFFKTVATVLGLFTCVVYLESKTVAVLQSLLHKQAKTMDELKTLRSLKKIRILWNAKFLYAFPRIRH
jgi:hypothetical protein